MEISTPLKLIPKNQAGLTTAPERMQRVHTRIRAVRPLSVTVRTFCRLGSQRRLFLLWAWLTLLPVAGPFPQISHTRAMIYSPYTNLFFEPSIFTSADNKRQVLFCKFHRKAVFSQERCLSERCTTHSHSIIP